MGKLSKNDFQVSVQRLEKLARLFDSQLIIPGTQIRFGLDAVLGLVPVVGDIISFLFSFFLFIQAVSHRVSKRTLIQMLMNLGIDTVIGSVPVVGDIFDVFSKANLKNIQLILKDIHTDIEKSN